KAVASAASLQSWFTNDTTTSAVCTDLALSLNCSSGTIARQAINANHATILAGMNLTPFGYTAGGAIHMRTNGDETPAPSSVCSFTQDNDGNKWKDSYDPHYGNALLVWLNGPPRAATELASPRRLSRLAAARRCQRERDAQKQDRRGRRTGRDIAAA